MKRRIWGGVAALAIVFGTLWCGNVLAAEGSSDRYADWLQYKLSVRQNPDCVLFLTFEESTADGHVRNLAGGGNVPGYKADLYDGLLQAGLTVTPGAGRWKGKAAVVLDGSVHNYSVEVPDGPGIRSAARQMSWEVWFKLGQSGEIWQGIIVKPGPKPYQNTRIGVSPDKRISAINVLLSSDQEGESNSAHWSRSTVSLDAWHQVIFVYDGDSERLYLDGVEESVHKHALHDANDRIDWGTYPSRIGAGLVGAIDEVACYNKALTADEVAAHYRIGQP